MDRVPYWDQKRHYAIAENTSDLATKVAQKLLQQAKLDATKNRSDHRINDHPRCFNTSDSCDRQKISKLAMLLRMTYPPHVRALSLRWQLLEKFIHSGMYQRAMVISAETNSKMMDFTDRTSAVFFLEMVLRGDLRKKCRQYQRI